MISIQSTIRGVLLIAMTCLLSAPLAAQVAVQGETVYTMAGPPIKNGVIIIRDGKIAEIGTADDVTIPDDFKVVKAPIVVPGLIDAHTVVGLGGMLNQDGDQDQLENSQPVQPALRAKDAYNGKDKLVDWIRSFGVTTIHTGHGPGELISGQTMIVKTTGNTVEDAMLVDAYAVAATLDNAARKSGGSSPGTRGKMIAMLRTQLIKATEYQAKIDAAEKEDDRPARDLELEALADVLAGKTPLMVTADRAQDIDSALRLANEFGFRLILDSAAESYLLIDEIKNADVPVIIHPTMARATGDRENMSFETAAKLVAAGIPVAMQSGFEGYVPKTRVVLFEAGYAAANGLSFEQALGTITIDAAKLLGIDEKVGSLEVGKDADVALFDGDPFEYTTHCVGVLINGQVVSDQPR